MIKVEGVTKRYGPTTAVNNISFEVDKGEIVGFLGPNGAGKTTTMRILTGFLPPTEGKASVAGFDVLEEPLELKKRIGYLPELPPLYPEMEVDEYLDFVARIKGIENAQVASSIDAVLERTSIGHVRSKVIGKLSKGYRQRVGLAQALIHDPEVLILDEPTASLTSHETEHLFGLLRRLKQQHVGIVYITHRIAEINEVGDRVTILRDGRFVDTVDAKFTSEDELVRLMTGRVVGEVFPKVTFQPGDTILEVENLHTVDGSLNGASAVVRKGEIVGIAGLIGSGKSKFGRACFGALGLRKGSITFKGERIAKPTPREMLDRGLLYLPSDRRDDGLMMMRPAVENISLAAIGMRPFSNGWIVDGRQERKTADSLAARLNLSPRRLDQATEQFSGGNQQKLMLARSLTRNFDLFVFDEPTVGVDVGTRTAIYEFIAELCKQGAAILLISSDLPEILNLSNRVYVFFAGSIQVELAGDDIDE